MTGDDLVLRDASLDLEDIILQELGETVRNASRLFGSRVVHFVIDGIGFDIETPREDPLASFDERLAWIKESARMVAKRSKVDYSKTMGLLLVIDGWSWNPNVFRAPIWMHDHRELPIEEARKIDGLEWLDGSSLAIRSELQRV
ncbi:MAG: hypothetical protein JW704_09775 [Anaerolineaceae bacterium]|nr:hypothetical protein [Anaerolineaceae bacterium]